MLMWSTGYDFDLDGWITPLPIYVDAAAVGCFGMGAGLLRCRPKLTI
ncbi:MAG: hypothetical protein JNL83_00080 [Myxococcales bacterium]|nr:hypothetical protein [Myxococcales bacterium]